MTGKTNAAARAGFVKGGDVLVSHSAGNAGMTDHGVVTLADGSYRLLEIKQSGTLTFDAAQATKGIIAESCLVGGGQGGGSGGYPGGNGGLMRHLRTFLTVSMTAVIGAGGSGFPSGEQGTGFPGGTTSLSAAGFSLSVSVGSGTGGGAGGHSSGSTVGTGDGLSKYPFSDPSHFNIHCGGGGGGRAYYNSSTQYSGGVGGTNGGNGSQRVSGSYSDGAAGDSSAGAGGSNAAYYGGGGGGGRYYTSSNIYAGANGYQGVIWIRIPA